MQKTVVFITHDLDEALKLADHLVILKDGSVVQQGEPQHILLNPAAPYIEDFVERHQSRARAAGPVCHDEDARVAGEMTGEIDHDDTLEFGDCPVRRRHIALRYRVMKDGKSIGVLDMQKLVRALVPMKQSTDADSAR